MINKNVGAIIVLGFVCSVVSPLFLYAQTEGEVLRLKNQIRSDLLSDPRTASLSPQEFEAMVNALAAETQSQQLSSDYVLPIPVAESRFQTGEGFVTPWGAPISTGMLYVIVLGSLLFAGILLWWLLRLHTHHMHSVE